MTYFNGNPYKGPTPDAPLDKFAHDDCLPDDLFTSAYVREWRHAAAAELAVALEPRLGCAQAVLRVRPGSRVSA